MKVKEFLEKQRGINEFNITVMPVSEGTSDEEVYNSEVEEIHFISAHGGVILCDIIIKREG